MKMPTWENIKKYFIFNIYDIALAGIFISLFIIVKYISNITLTGRFNVSFEIAFYIIFGIVFGPIKGLILAILGDTLILFIRGNVGTWMIEYAAIPPMIAVFAWAYYTIFKTKKDIIMLLPIAIFSLVATTLITVFVSKTDKQKWKIEGDRITELSADAVLYFMIAFITISFIFLMLLMFFYFKFKRSKNPDENTELWAIKIKNVILYFSLVLFIILLVRWLWSPFAFIAYYNRFIATTSHRSIETYYVYYMIPLLLKGLFTIPLYTFVLFVFVPSITKLNKRYKNNTFLTAY